MHYFLSDVLAPTETCGLLATAGIHKDSGNYLRKLLTDHRDRQVTAAATASELAQLN